MEKRISFVKETKPKNRGVNINREENNGTTNRIIKRGLHTLALLFGWSSSFLACKLKLVFLVLVTMHRDLKGGKN